MRFSRMIDPFYRWGERWAYAQSYGLSPYWWRRWLIRYYKWRRGGERL